VIHSQRRLTDKAAITEPVPAYPRPSTTRDASGFRSYALIVLMYTLATVAWGAIVRATGSGAGCGNHWPFCDGHVLPVFNSYQRIFEFAHRASTGLILPLSIGLVVWARKVFPAGSMGRKASYGVFAMTIVEALIGMVLVLAGWVNTNPSAARAYAMGTHVVSTFILMGFLVAAIQAGRGVPPITLKGQGAVGWMLGACVTCTAMLGISGAISALGHQLWPSKDVLKAAAAANAPWMVRLQPMHPFLATSIALLTILTVGLLLHLRPTNEVRRASRYVAGAFGAEMCLGVINIWLNAPVWMQAAHLVVADLTFASLIVLAIAALGVGVPHKDSSDQPEEAPHLHGRDLVNAYVGLTKPRVISLLLFTTLTAAFAAAGGWPGFWTLLALTIGGYMSAGAANAINMVIDRDIDATMKRTSKRPTVTQAIPSTHALFFAGVLAWGSFGLLWIGCNLLTAMLALAGLVFYVIVYTLLLKRRTWHNIVIGGAAGAFPPLVGWAAINGTLAPLAIYMFAIVLVWTPVHFWALALLIKEDYASAGVPMLPVVKGDRATTIQIALYTVVTVAVTLIPFFQGLVGGSYLIAAALLNAGLVFLTVRLYRQTDRTTALHVFKYSMIYLALLFLMVAVDRAHTL
jgi:protoheme IX farnesyltransferase